MNQKFGPWTIVKESIIVERLIGLAILTFLVGLLVIGASTDADSATNDPRMPGEGLHESVAPLLKRVQIVAASTSQGSRLAKVDSGAKTLSLADRNRSVAQHRAGKKETSKTRNGQLKESRDAAAVGIVLLMLGRGR